MTNDSAGRAPALYWPVQLRRNRGVVGLFIVVAGFVAVYAWLFPGILTVGGVSKFAQSWLPLALVSMAQAMLLLTGGISLAIGPSVSLGVVIAATTMSGVLGVPGGILLVAVAGLGIGALTGFIVVRLHLPAIIVTLAGSFIIPGAALLILPPPGGAIPPWFSDLPAGNTPVALTLVVVVALLWKLYLATPLGLSLYAAGENPVGAYRAGVRVDLARIVAYALSGLLSTAAGLFIAAQIGSGDPVIGEAYTLNSIAAVVLGGTSLLGGVGGAVASLVGAAILRVISFYFRILDIDPLLQPLIEGLVLLIAVSFGAIRTLRVKNKLDLFR
ncbi:MAG TPA: ABC transporter permease [Bauldia sp.]|nr:ABC transporter permease [Bauldia sp.]